MNAECILVVEDEEKIAALLTDYLQQSGYRTHCIARGDEVTSWVRDNDPDLVLLDIMLPGKDGLAVCREIRAFSNLPIIMVTARVEEIDRLLGLGLGADDYICKPFSTREVIARVKAVLRRVTEPVGNAEDGYRGLRIDIQRFEVSVSGRLVELTPVEFRILSLLAQSPGRVYSRDALIQHMYLDGRIVSDRTVDSHVKNLRKKLVAATADEGWIRSIYGVGYRID
jgi:two-component system response regulator BaeR